MEASIAINFTIPQEGQVFVKFYDLTGKELLKLGGTYSVGDHSITVKRSDLNGACGVMYYLIDCEQFSQTKEMILIRLNEYNITC